MKGRMSESSRRTFLRGGAAAGTLLLVDACQSRAIMTPGPEPRSPPRAPAETKSKHDTQSDEPEVTATEDMMREHGVLRRALIVYTEAARLLRTSAGRVSPDVLHNTAKLFRDFGEDYHEKKLEEAYVFPAVKKSGGAAASLSDVLTAQHQRGREITDYILSVTAAPKLGAKAADVASVLEGFVRMYESHTAREDTVVFPAWKKTLSAKELDEIGEKFEAIEHAQFGGDGFALALQRMTSIEGELGIADLSGFTAPALSKGA
jgi:hemerythrin-like domain-containing protein